MSLWLGGLIGMGTYCNVCASGYCHHIATGMAAQQQTSIQQYYELLKQAGQLNILAPPSGTREISDSPPSISVKQPENKSFDKKLLLLRR
jgi:hypothetical protein